MTKFIFLNVLYLLISSAHTYCSWIYKSRPDIQLLLQSAFKIIAVGCICKMNTGSWPRVVLRDKHLWIASLLYSGSSLCTFELWNRDHVSPFTYSMGTKPVLFTTDIIQHTRLFENRWAVGPSILSMLGFIFVSPNLLPLFTLKCLLSSAGSFVSSLGLGFGQNTDFRSRCSKIVSFSLISMALPLFLSRFVSNEPVVPFEYAYALLGASNGLVIAFLLSYNGALIKVGVASAKDILFLLISAHDLSMLKILSVCFQGVVSTWVVSNPRKVSKTTDLDHSEKVENIKGPEV